MNSSDSPQPDPRLRSVPWVYRLARLAVVLALGSGMLVVYQRWEERVDSELRQRALDSSLAAARPGEVPDDVHRGWPNLFGPDHNSHATGEDVVVEWPGSGPPERWRCEIGTGYSAPIVWDNKVIAFHREANEEVIECLDAQSGIPQWGYKYPTNYECKFEYSNGPYSTPSIDTQNRTVIAIGAEAMMHCIALETGDVLWKRDLREEFQIPENTFGFGTSPLMVGDRIIVNVGGATPDSGIVAFDAQTGKPLWSSTNYGASYATPCSAEIHGHHHVFVFTDEGLVSVDPQDGRVRWNVKFGVRKQIDRVNATSPLTFGDRVLVTAGPGPGNLCLRLKPDGGYEKIWASRRALDSQFNNLCCVDGYVYGFTSVWNGGAGFRCVDLLDGEVQWKWRSELVRGSSLAVNGRFILLGEYGHLASLEITPDEPIIHSMTTEPLLNAPCYSAPALSQGRLFLRNEEFLLCLDLRKN